MKQNNNWEIKNYPKDDNDTTHLDVQVSGIISDAVYLRDEGADIAN